MFNVYNIESNITVELSAPVPNYPIAIVEKVNSLWDREAAKKGLFNGAIFCVTEVSPSVVKGYKGEYKYYFAQRAMPELFEMLTVRPLAVSGFLECQEGYVLGQRAKKVTDYAQKWEFAPSGGIDPDAFKAGLVIDFYAQILKELSEEIGVLVAPDTQSAYGLVENTDTHVMDIGVYLGFRSMPFDHILALHAETGQEYEALVCHKAGPLEAFLKKYHFVPESLALWQEFFSKRV